MVQTANLHKLELKGRLYGSYIYGDNVPGEFLLNLGGASTEELLENKFTRAAGIIPEPWMTYSTTGNHFQLGGGLNLRGFAGYVNMMTHKDVNYSVFNGNYGGAINMEVDFDRYLEFLQISSLNRFIHIDSYLFADAGILGAYLKDVGAAVPEFKLQTNILADAGAGIALTIKKWGMLDDPKPLTIRLDVPYYRSITLPGETQNTAFRWVLGVGRCF